MKTLFKHILFALSAITWTNANAQSIPATEPCGSGIIHEHLLESDPHYARHIWNMERKIDNANAELAERGGEILSVPTVVHVVHIGEPIGQGSNISDEQIFSAIAALNEDFRKVAGSNGDGDGVDVGIEFCLAARDPQGNSSNGIVRVNGSSVPNYAEMGIGSVNSTGASEAAVKALSTWPGSSYLNIWIVNEIENNDGGSGIQGYAYFPTVSPLDGIVLLHNVFGTVGNLKPSSNMNRTTSHEAGHYLALYHTFHNTTSCTESNCTTGGDRVCDTPPTVLNNSCNSPECSGTQQVENYMDYTGQTCRNMFSQGQSDRMRATLMTDRSSLLSSLGCTPVTSLDAGISAIHSPIGSLCNSQITPEISVTNYGSNTLTSVEVDYGYTGGAVHSYTWTGTLVTGNSSQFTLPAFTSGSGNQTFYARVAGVNNGADEYDGNDEMTQNYAIATGAGVSIVFTVDYFGSETTWELFDDSQNLMASGGPYIDNNQGTQFTENICLSEGCYALTVYDVYGDGMGFTSGNFQIYDNEGNNLGGAAGNFGPDETIEFCAVPDVVTGNPPTASFSMTSNEICVGENVDFSNLSEGDGNSYNWTFSGASPSSSAQTNPQNITYNTAGTFNVTLAASNAYGADSETIQITVHPAPTLSMSSNNVTCNGAANGNASVLATGNGPFSYSWNGGGSNSSISNLTPGTYTVTATDLNACSASSSATITQPSVLTVNISATQISCNGDNNGALQASVGGGNGGNSYSWSNGGQGSSINNLSAGSYVVTVNDSQGCEKSASAVLVEPNALETGLQVFHISCGVGSGSAAVNPSGGTAPYTIEWSNGGSNENSGNLSAGSYGLTIEDSNGCSISDNFSVESGSSLSVVLDVTHISCSGMSDGSIDALVGGGNGPFDYDWSNGDSEQNLGGLEAGTYSVSVSDSQGCTGTASATVLSPSQLNSSISLVNPEGCVGNDGELMAAVSGGNAPYTFNWSNGSENQGIIGLASGNYILTITDANGCNDIATANVPYNCNEIIEGPSLIQADCGTSGLMISDEIECEVVPNAEMYLWRFENNAAGILTEEYTVGNNTTFQLSNITGLVYGITLDVRVKALVDGVWSPFGEACNVSMDELVPSTQLTKTDCGIMNASNGTILHCVDVPGADLYEWRFSNGSTEILLTSYIPQLSMSLNDGFIEGEIYEVTVRTTIGEQVADYGLPCEFGFNVVLGIDDLNELQASLVFYPNPNNGSKIFFDLHNLSELDDVIDLELYDTNGKLIDKFTLYYPGRSSFTTEHQFKTKLSAGMYFLKYSMADKVSKEKLIVR